MLDNQQYIIPYALLLVFHIKFSSKNTGTKKKIQYQLTTKFLLLFFNLFWNKYDKNTNNKCFSFSYFIFYIIYLKSIKQKLELQ